MSPVGKDMHVFRLVGTRENGTEQTFYRWAFIDTATELAVSAFDRALDASETIATNPPGDASPFVSWRLECSCQEWVSANASRPAELAGIGFIHLLATRIDG